MIWLWAYLFAGVLILLGFLRSEHMTRRKDPSDFLDVLKQTQPNTERLQQTDKSAIYALARVVKSALTIVAWPAVLGLEIWTARAKEKLREKRQKIGFEVKKDDLIEELSQEQIEALEQVTDPLKAAPSLPFGHLNAAWIEFLGKVEPDDRLWSFTAEWNAPVHRKEQAIGYVAVRGKRIGPYFISTIKEIR